MNLIGIEDFEMLMHQIEKNEPGLFNDDDYHFKLADLQVKILIMQSLGEIANSLEGLYVDGIIHRY